jgi:hypothetical protein
MRTLLSFVGLTLVLSASLGCSSSGVESLQGGWTGQIVCLGDTSQVSLGLFTDQTRIWGSAQIRTKGSNSDYTVDGSQSDVDRLLECQNSTCTQNADCASKLDGRGASSKSTCQNGLCDPCYESQVWPQVTLVLRDNNVQIPDPALELWRYGEGRLEGTITKYCPDEALQTPQVKLNKEQ